MSFHANPVNSSSHVSPPFLVSYFQQIDAQKEQLGIKTINTTIILNLAESVSRDYPAYSVDEVYGTVEEITELYLDQEACDERAALNKIMKPLVRQLKNLKIE